VGDSSQLEGLQISGETVVATVEETSFSIDEIIQELYRLRVQKFHRLKLEELQQVLGDMVEGLSQPQESHERVTSTPHRVEIQ